jgi:hypothetical protein
MGSDLGLNIVRQGAGSAVRSSFRSLARSFRDSIRRAFSHLHEGNSQLYYRYNKGYRYMEEIMPMTEDLADAGNSELMREAMERGTVALARNLEPEAELWSRIAVDIYKAVWGRDLGPVKLAIDRAATRAAAITAHMATVKSFKNGLSAVITASDVTSTLFYTKSVNHIADMKRILPLLTNDVKILQDEVLENLIARGMSKLRAQDVYIPKYGIHLANEMDDEVFWDSLAKRLYQLHYGEEEGLTILENARRVSLIEIES